MEGTVSCNTIQWFPGHMTKAMRMMEDNIALVDAVIEIVDARIPKSSSNPELKKLANGKPMIALLNKSDLADPDATAKWLSYYKDNGISAVAVDAKTGKGTESIVPLVKQILADKIAAYEAKGQAGRPIRLMIVGIPNVGKSSLINRLAKRKAAQTGDKPGVTKGKQWIKLQTNFELLDTPGVLWPKIENQFSAELLAVTNAIKAEILDIEAVAADFIGVLANRRPDMLLERFKVQAEDDISSFDLLEKAAVKRGFILRGGVADTERMAHTLLNEYQAGKLGRITLEYPDD